MTDFDDPEVCGSKPPADLRVGRDMVRTASHRYELVKRVTARDDGWVIVETDRSSDAVPGCFPVAWMDRGYARDLKLAAIERFG